MLANNNGLVSLQKAGCLFGTEFIRSGKALGAVVTRFRADKGPWLEADTRETQGETFEVESFSKARLFENGFKIKTDIRQANGGLVWRIHLENSGDQILEVGDLALPLEMNVDYTKDVKETFEGRVFKHAQVTGDNSFIFWQPTGGKGSYLVMRPEQGSYLEFFKTPQTNYCHGGEVYHVYIHSKAVQEETEGSWRQDPSSLFLGVGESKTYSFNFQWTDSYDGVRNIIYNSGGIDIKVVPGMVVPEDHRCRFLLKTKLPIHAVEAEFGDEVKCLGEDQQDTHIYFVKFTKLGENKIEVSYGCNQKTQLEFFVTESLETLIKKRADFICKNQQHKDPSKWYDGLYSLWDCRLPAGQNKLGPDNLGGQHEYCVSGSDDPSNSKCIYLAEKNVVYPDKEEIASLEYFIENFVWGKHQRSDKEQPFPYGIYGSDSWLTNRQSANDPIEECTSRPQAGGSQCRMWRTFDYTTYFALYYNMYIIAKQNPSMVKFWSAETYLERAFGTAKAYFEVPYNIMMTEGWAHKGWTDWAYKLGNFHEKYLLPIIDALIHEGQLEQATYLTGEWEKKVKYFLYDDEYPWVSEMPVDSTAYESTYAIAKYSLTKEMLPDKNLWQDKNTGEWYSHPEIDLNKHQNFLNRQLAANLACRGYLESNYYQYGSDFRALGSTGYTMSYMSQMGGWSILDQALNFEEEPFELIRLGYGSLLCSWGLVNSGTEETDYGYWFKGKEHDGAVSWGFMPQMNGSEWNQAVQNAPRGAWGIDGEIEHGLVAGVEAACCVVVNDPEFGFIAYGGEVDLVEDKLLVKSLDGVRRKIYVIDGNKRLELSLDKDGFLVDEPLMISLDQSEISFTVERRSSSDHLTLLTVKDQEGKETQFKLEFNEGKEVRTTRIFRNNKKLVSA
ncbi:MAG: DUF5695 domain-containing protein [Lentisphaerales bacterium]|nr:DUF5695 domain-containing protein [Lentisphaerales bacterium]